MAVTVVTRLNRLPQVKDTIRKNVAAAVAKAAFDIEAQAKVLVPVDTGNLRSSIQTQMESDISATVGPRGVEYAVYVEYGTGRAGDPSVPHADVAGRPAHPYLRPAVEKVRPAFVAAMEQVAKV